MANKKKESYRAMHLILEKEAKIGNIINTLIRSQKRVGYTITRISFVLEKPWNKAEGGTLLVEFKKDHAKAKGKTLAKRK
jgi:hypothetical protein